MSAPGQDAAATREYARVELFWQLIEAAVIPGDYDYDDSVSRLAECVCELPSESIAWVRRGERFATIELYVYGYVPPTGSEAGGRAQTINRLGYNEVIGTGDPEDGGRDRIVRLRQRPRLGS